MVSIRCAAGVRRFRVLVAFAALAAASDLAAQCPETPPGGIGPACVPTGTIIVRKVTTGGTGSFDFTATPAPPLANFSLAGGGSRTFGGVALGTYVVTESVPAGWALTSIA
jgi:hypothetical protein